MLWAARLTLFLAAVSGVMVWRARRDHRPLALFLTWFIIATAARAVLASRFGLIRPLGSPPFTGAARLAFHVDQAIELSWSAGLAAMAMTVFGAGRRSALPVVGLLWGALVAYLAINYPEIRGDALRKGYLAAELVALAVAAASIVTWTWRKDSPSPARIGVLALCLTDGVTLLAGAWRWGFWVHWDLNQAAFAIIYATIAVYQVIIWRRILSQSSQG